MLAALALAPAAARACGDPFAPGQRWVWQAPAAAPWMPHAARFAAGGELVWASAGGADRRLALLETTAAHGTQAPRFEAPGAAASLTPLELAASERADALWSLAQLPAPDAWKRRVVVARHDPLAPAPEAPLWLHDLDLTTNAAARLVVDRAGERLVAAAFDAAGACVQLDFLDAESGALQARVRLPAAQLGALAISADGARVALTAGLALHVLDGAGAPRMSAPLASATSALALSAGGGLLVAGAKGKAQLWREQNGAYLPLATLVAGPSWLPRCAALSDRGETLAIGWWDAAGGVDVRLDVWDGREALLLHSRVQSGAPGGPQNLPVGARVTPDGRRVAFATWGGGGAPELLLLERAQPVPVLALDLPGSALDLDLDASGTRLIVAHKDAHAGEAAATGALRLFDTGERDLQALAPARLGAGLPLAARRAGASSALFLAGEPRARPLAFPGVAGRLWLERRGLVAHWSAADGEGRADLVLELGTEPALVGRGLGLQALFAGGFGRALSRTRARPLVLLP